MGGLVRPPRHHQVDPPVLTPLQAEVRRIIGELGRQQEFALGGGAALIAHGIIDRATRDLDFLGPAGTVVDGFVHQVERHLRTLSFSTERTFEYPQLVRLKVSHDGEDLSIDIGVDYRSFPVVDTPEGLLMHEHDLAGDKLLAFCRREEVRDLHDLIALEARHGVAEMCRLAADKDPMFKSAWLDRALESIEADPRFTTHHAVIERWRNEIALLPPVHEEPDFEIDF